MMRLLKIVMIMPVGGSCVSAARIIVLSPVVHEIRILLLRDTKPILLTSFQCPASTLPFMNCECWSVRVEGYWTVLTRADMVQNGDATGKFLSIQPSPHGLTP